MKKAIFAGVMLALTATTFAQVDPARVIATVNGVEIKGAEYYHRMELLPGVGKVMGDGLAEFPPGFLTLEQLITEKLIFQLAKEKGVMPNAAEIQAELDYRKLKNPNLTVDWFASGRTQEELLNQVKFDLAQFKILTAGITVTDLEVDDFYKKNALLFTTPQQVKLRVIVARTKADADAVDKELAAGKPFADVAKAHSADVTAGVGGDYGTVPVTALSPSVKEAVQTLLEGQTTRWFAASQAPDSKEEPASFKFLLQKSIPATLRPLDADLRRQARQQMMMNIGRTRNNVKGELDALRAKANIDIKEPWFAAAYKRFLDASLKAAGKG